MRSMLILIVATVLAPTVHAQETKPVPRFSGPKEKLHIYILVGQSNMSGRAKVEEEDRQIPKNLYLLDAKGDWVQAMHPFIQYTNTTNGADVGTIKAKGKTGLNLGLTFARRMLEANPDTAIGLVVNSQGGSAIESWKKTGKASNYDKTLERVRPIQNTGIIKGVLWHQGESNLDLGEKYLDSLDTVIAQFRKDLTNPKLPFVAGQIAPLPKGKEKIQAFNQALLKFPTRTPHTGVVRADDLSGQDIHFDSAETRKLGLRYAEEMIRLQGK
jgi:hypothetical protein